MKLLKLIICALFLFAYSGCKKFLEEEPLKQASIKTVLQLEALANNGADYSFQGDDPTAAYGTDDTQIPLPAYLESPTSWPQLTLFYYTFDVANQKSTGYDGLWINEYKKIFTANLILQNIDKVTGDDVVRAQVKADAYFMRAYSNWVLVNHYCLPYSPSNLSSLGLPLKKSTDYGESIVRANLKETYDFIESDLNEAMKVDIDDVQPKLRWRVSKKAVQAFLSRYYLFKGDYDKSLANSNLALASNVATTVNFRTVELGYIMNFDNPADSINFSIYNNQYENESLYYPDFYYTRFSYTRNQWRIPSPSLTALFDKANDFRYKLFFAENGNRRFGLITKVPWYNVFTGGRYLPSGPTHSEMLLNKAEVLARKGQIADAMATVNILRLKRFDNPAPLAANSQDDAIKKVLEERRRELPFGMRFLDIRRFGVNDYPGDDVTVTHTFYKVSAASTDINSTETYTISPNSKKLVVPISQEEINASQGQIKQNEY